MAADVMMGNDQDCAAWIAQYREQPGRAVEGRAGRRGAGGRRRADAERRSAIRRRRRSRERGRGLARRLHPVGQAGAVRRGHEPAGRGALARGRPGLGLRRARHLWPLPGGGERGRVRQARHHLARRSPHGVQRARGALPRARRASPPIDDWGATRASAATWSSTCRRRARSTARSCARKPTRTRSRSIRSCGCTTSRSASPTSPTPAATCSGCSRRSTATGPSTGSACDRARARVAAADAARRRLDGHGRRARRVDDHGDLARLPRRRAGRGVRHRLDHGGRAPLRPAHRRGARERRRDEPADPVRRGPDEPRELRDDESRRRGRADRA